MKQLKQLKRLLCNFAEEEDAVGVVEIIFKEQLTNLVRSILSKIAKQSNSI